MPGTELAGRFEMDMNAFADAHPGQLSARMDGYLSLADLRPFLTSIPGNIRRALPTGRVTVQGQLEGNLRSVSFRQLHLSLPGCFDLTGTGWVADMMRGSGHLRSDLHLKGTVGNIDFINSLLPKAVRRTVSIPHGIGLDGTVHVRRTLYTGRMRLTQGAGGSGWMVPAIRRLAFTG